MIIPGLYQPCRSMAIWVVKFPREGCKISYFYGWIRESSNNYIDRILPFSVTVIVIMISAMFIFYTANPYREITG